MSLINCMQMMLMLVVPVSVNPLFQMHADVADAAGLSPLERRRARLQAEQAARDAQLRDWQRQHWQEVKAAAARNRQQVRNRGTVGTACMCSRAHVLCLRLLAA
jgi:hypothetical protein